MPALPVTPESKLEAVLAAYVAANYQGAGEPLAGVTLCLGHTLTPQTAEHRVVFEAGQRGGPHARQGNYEVPLAIHIVTNAKEQPGDTTDRLTLHEQRVEALAGIFGEDRIATVAAALMVLDAALGVSAYWGSEHERDFSGPNFETTLRKTFAVHLPA
ncbi:MAG: hypothetical protein ABMA13_18400 [Chthoniobacteraceae bacterium]